MRRKLACVLGILAAAILLGLIAVRFHRFMLQDSCLDAGCAFDHESLACRTDVQTLPP